MLQLTKRTEYGLIALVHMADREGDVVSVREISEHYPIPRRLLAEVLKDLTRASLVESQRGATGGYTLARSADHISLSEIVAALEGRPTLSNCDASSHAVHGAPTATDAISAESKPPSARTSNGHAAVQPIEANIVSTNEDAAAHTNCGIAPMCPIRSPLSRIRDGLWGLMERTTLRSLARPSTPTVTLSSAMLTREGAAAHTFPRIETT